MAKLTTAVRSFRFPQKLADSLDALQSPNLSTFIKAAVAAFISRPSSKPVPYLGKTSECKYKIRLNAATKRLWASVAKRYCAKPNISQLLTMALYRQLKPQAETGRGL